MNRQDWTCVYGMVEIKKCATNDECYNKWWLGSSDRDKCILFDPSSHYTVAFDCTYCCTGKNCNADIKPPRDTWLIWDKW